MENFLGICAGTFLYLSVASYLIYANRVEVLKVLLDAMMDAMREVGVKTMRISDVRERGCKPEDGE